MRIRDPRAPIRAKNDKKYPFLQKYFGGVFGSFLGSDGGSCDHRCLLWPPWMRLDEVADWVWARI